MLWWYLLSVVFTYALAAEPAKIDGDSELPRHPLEIQALTDPDSVLNALPQALADSIARADGRQTAQLHLARANACRMVADWPCQRGAGLAARAQADLVNEPILAIRGLIAEARANFALQDYTRGERLLADAEIRLRRAPSAELSADVALAYSSLSDMLGKHVLALEYADRGLTFLLPGKALPMRVRLLRNRARAQALLGDLIGARNTLDVALPIATAIVDPKLRAELHLEAARIARTGKDREEVERNTELALQLAQQLKNSQLAGLAHELRGLAATDDNDRNAAERELQESLKSFKELGLARDELRVLRELAAAQLKFSRTSTGWAEVVERMLQLESSVTSRDRALASDDFDARLLYAEQALELVRLESNATLGQERESAMAKQHRLTGFLVLLSVAILAVLVVSFVAQRRSNRRLRASLGARLRALTQTSHELRNPISGVLGLAELLLRSPTTAAQRSMIEAIRSAGTTIEKLAQDLLDRGRIESGQLSLVLRAASLQQLAESVCQLYQPRAREKGLQLRLEFGAEVLDPILFDVERLQQVLSNLIGNSLKFTERGEICFSVRSLARSNDGRIRVRFAVQDSGPGIEADEIAGLFEPFAKGRAGQRHRAGAGLGLAISADLVRLMGGQIAVESQPGAGALFHFELTFAVAELPEAKATPDSAGQGAGLSVLLVDDDEDVTLALNSQLEVLGCVVEFAASSQAARAKVADFHFDLLLLDVDLPDGQGPDLARHLRAFEPNMQRTRVAIVSGYQAPKTLPAGVDEWLTKPVLLDRLNMLVAAARQEMVEGEA